MFFRLKDRQQGKNSVEQSAWIRHKYLLSDHRQRRGEEFRRRQRTPNDKYEGDDQPDETIQFKYERREREDHHRQETVAEDARDEQARTGLVGRGHHIQQAVHSHRAERDDAVDVTEMDLAEQQETAGKGETEDERTGEIDIVENGRVRCAEWIQD